MRLVNSLFLSPGVNDWLTDAHHPRILHVFDHVCNLLNERGNVLSVVTPQIGNGPFNLVLEENIHFPEYLTLNSSIFNSTALIKLGELTIHTTKAKLWNPHPDWEMLNTKRIQILDQIKQLRINDYLKNSSLSLPQSLTSSLSAALVHSSISTATSSASQLAGLGIGLTPSGDDFMVGAIYAVWIIHPPEIACVLAEAIANTAAPLTTSLSAAWLRAAGRGKAGIVWHEFLNALLFHDSLRILKALKNILAVGETSGADALAGFIGVLKSWMGEAGSKHG
jgi:hypothetical protein